MALFGVNSNCNNMQTDGQALPLFVKGETGPHEPSLREGKTKPPSHFTSSK